MPDTCPSCGVEYVQHLGLIGACAELVRVRAECDRLRARAENAEEGLTVAYMMGSASRLDEVRGLRNEVERLRLERNHVYADGLISCAPTDTLPR